MSVLHLRGVLLPDEVQRDVWIVDGHLTFEAYNGPTQTIASAGWVIPGLVDAHCHIGHDRTGHLHDPAELAAQALIDRDAGVLLIRDAGSPVDNSSVQRREDLPRLIRAGRHIARPRRYIRDLGVEVEPDDLVAEVETQAARGDGWVKLAADWIDRDSGDLSPVWPDEVLVRAIARAHELGARVAAHVFGEEALPALLRAGIDSLEHACGLTPDLFDLCLRNGTVTVPTLVNLENFPDIAAKGEEKFPHYARHMRALYATSRQRVRDSWDAGIAFYTGTDAGATVPHGLVREEIALLVGAGIAQHDVIAQASWRAREWLGLPGLVEGAPADLVVYPADPRRELATLFEPVATVLRGKVIQTRR